MASIGALYGPAGHSLFKRPAAVAAYGNVKIDTPAYTHFETNKKPEFVAKFPTGQIPAFEASNGFRLLETTAIAKYIASKSTRASQLLGTTEEEKALVDQWLSFAQSSIHPHTVTIMLLTSGKQPYFKPLHTATTEKVLKAIQAVEKTLATRTFLITERITVADIVLASNIQHALGYVLGKDERAQFPNVIRHFETVANVPEIKAVFGETTYTEKPAVFVPPKKEKPATEAKPKAEKTEKPKAEPKPKAEKKKDEDDDEDLDLAPPEEPKAKNPLDLLPKSTFNLEDWKRAYSNMDTRGANGSLEWFYKNFDAEGFSIWRVDFKYNDELTQTFMSSNQIGGFFNRLEASRKYLFGSVGVLGKTNDSVISGVLVARGQDIKPVVDVAPDWESYDYKSIDLKDDAQKAFFEGAMAWDLEIDGKAWVDGKNFK